MRNKKNTQEKEEVIVKLPKFLAKYRPGNPNTVCIDKEIVKTIQYLWKSKIETLGCCSGHGASKPNIVIAEGYSDKDIKNIRNLIKKVDKRKWVIYQWRLTEV